MLKICMFRVFRTHYKSATQPINWSEIKDDKLFDFVTQIFHLLLKCSRDEVLDSYIFPWQNVFTFARDSTLHGNDNHVNCCYRVIFAKMILMLLGEEQDFKDIDKRVLLDTNTPKPNLRYGQVKYDRVSHRLIPRCQSTTSTLVDYPVVLY